MANPLTESQHEIIPLRDPRKKMLQRLLTKIVPWENTTVSTNDFAEFIDEKTKVLLKECVASHLKQSEFRKYRSALKSSSNRILLQSIPGTELYRERLVTAIAKELQVPLLKLDCLDYGDEDDSDGDGDNNNEEEEDKDDDDESEEEVQTLEKGNEEVEEDRRGDEEEEDDTSDGDEDNNNEEDDNNREEVHGGGEDNNGDDDKSEEEVQALEKGNKEVEEDHRGQEEEEEEDDAASEDNNNEEEEDNNREEVHGGGGGGGGGGESNEEEEDEDDDDDDDDEEEEDDDDDESEEVQVCALEKGDRVKYVGKEVRFPELNNRSLSSGQEGEVCEVIGGRVGVVFNICDLKPAKKAKKERGLLTWLQATDVTKYRDAKTHDVYVARELLETVVESNHPIIVYLPLCFSWTWTDICSAKEVFDQFQQGVVIICAQDTHDDSTPKETDKYKKVYKKKYTRGRRWHDSDIYRYAFMDSDIHEDQGQMRRVFTNVFSIKPPQGQYLNKLITQIEQDMRPLISQRNLHKIHKVLKLHDLSCTSLEHANLGDNILSKEEVGKIVGWAENHYLSSCNLPSVKEEKLDIPYQSIEVAHSRLKEGETQLIKQSKNIKDLATNSSEEKLVSAVVNPEDIGVTFEDVGALENVKKTLYETVILPLRRPELFSRGNLLKPCKGILLFGPPGTGKTLVAKALATESGAHFINITTATITSKWVGETENLTRALFSFATKLAPVIIFVDEVDSLFGVRGCNEYDTSRMNEFMAAWDGFTSKDSQRITVIGATNRPFDLDEAVLRRMPRRIYVGLPDAENRSKILKILLKEENLESGFSFEQLAQATLGYSGSDLKNLCIAAAYRPIEELLEQESKGEKSQAVPVPAPALRPLNLNDFLCSKAKVKPSVSTNMQSIIKLRIWNEQYGQGDGEDDIAWN